MTRTLRDETEINSENRVAPFRLERLAAAPTQGLRRASRAAGVVLLYLVCSCVPIQVSD